MGFLATNGLVINGEDEQRALLLDGVAVHRPRSHARKKGIKRSMTIWTFTNGIGRYDCNSVDEFLQVLAPSDPNWGWQPRLRRTSWVFRGHSDSSWPLLPNAWRDPPAASIQRAHALVLPRVPPLTGVTQWDHTGTLPAPPVIDLTAARQVIIQANVELLLLAEFLHRIDELGIDILGGLPPTIHQAGVFEVLRPVAADDFLQLQGLEEQSGLAQHYGVPTRLLDWSDDGLTAAYFAASSPSGADRLCVWALNEELSVSQVQPLWGNVALTLKVIRPPRSTNSYLRAQRGAFTAPWGAGCYALMNNGTYPTIEGFVSAIHHLTGPGDILRCITLPRTLANQLLEALQRHWITADTLMPSATTVAGSILGP